MTDKDWNDTPYVDGDCIRDEDEWNNIVTCIRNKSFDYTIYKKDDICYALNGATGNIDSSGTNAATVIQYAFDQLSSGGHVHIKNGTYDVGNNTISVPSNILITGGGWNTVIHQSVSIDKPVIANEDRVSGNSNIIIMDIAIKNTAPYAGSDQVCSEFEKCTAIRVSRVYVESVYDGVEFAQSSDCIVESSRLIALAGNTNAAASGIEFDHSGGGTYLKAVNNYIEGFPNGIATDANQQASLIQGNTIIDSVKYGIFLQSPFVEGTTQEITITDNYISGTQEFDAIRIASTVHSIIITDNIAINNALHGCRVLGSSKLIITDNIFTDNYDGIKIETTGAHVPAHFVIEDNILLDNSNLPFEIVGAPTDYIVKSNIGYVTENGGAAAGIVDGGTIAHGLAATPTHVQLTPSIAGEMASATAIGAANITVAIKTHAGAAGTSQVIYWRAWI